MVQLHRLAACDECGRQYDVSATPELAGLSAGEGFDCSCGARVRVPKGKGEDAAVVACSSCGGPREGTEESCHYCGSTFTLRELDLDAICPRCMARVSRRGRFCHHCAVPLTAPAEGPTATHYACPACSSPPAEAGEPATAGTAPPGHGAQAEGGGTAGQGPGTEGAGGPGPGTAGAAQEGAAKQGAGTGGDGTAGRGVGAAGDGTAGPGKVRRLVSRRIGQQDPLHLFECDVCAGMWLDREVFTALVERAKRGRVALPGLAPSSSGAAGRSRGPGATDSPGRWRYRPCAVCGNLMLRRNYGRRSGVIIDLCGDHGLWFDADELHRVLSWVEIGGSTQAEADATARAEAAKRKSSGTGSVPVAPFPSGGGYRRGFGEFTGSIVLEGIAWLVDSLLDTRWR